MSDRAFPGQFSAPTAPFQTPQTGPQGGSQTPPPAQPLSGQGVAPTAPAQPQQPVQGFVTHGGENQHVQQTPQQQADPRLVALEQENAQFKQAFGSIVQRAQQAEEQQRRADLQNQYNERIKTISTTAARMGAVEGQAYFEEQSRALVSDLTSAMDQVTQEANSRIREAGMRMALPQYADDIIRSEGLPQEYRQYLLTAPDMQTMYGMAQFAVQQHRNNAALQQQMEQMRLGTQATQMGYQAAGMGAGLGTLQPTPQVNTENMDPDQKAQKVWQQIQEQRRSLIPQLGR